MDTVTELDKKMGALLNQTCFGMWQTAVLKPQKLLHGYVLEKFHDTLPETTEEAAMLKEALESAKDAKLMATGVALDNQYIFPATEFLERFLLIVNGLEPGKSAEGASAKTALATCQLFQSLGILQEGQPINVDMKLDKELLQRFGCIRAIFVVNFI